MNRVNLDQAGIIGPDEDEEILDRINDAIPVRSSEEKAERLRRYEERRELRRRFEQSRLSRESAAERPAERSAE